MHMQSDDEVIVARCLGGDQAAFAFLVEKYKGAVHAYAYHRVLDYQEAQDIVQEVFIKAYKKLAQLKWPHRFQSWLYAIASNECSTWLRERLKEREREAPLEDVPAENLDELAVRAHGDKDIELTVRSAMEALPGDSQLALSLYYMSGLSTKEVAGFMGISPNNVGVKLHRARKQLGERLEKMLGRQLRKEKMRSGFTFTLMDCIRGMPIPSLPKPRPNKWMPIPVSIGLALLIGIIGFGISSGKGVSSETQTLKPATFEVSLLPDPDGQTFLDTESEKINDLVVADAGTTTQIQPTAGTESSGIVVRRVWDNAQDAEDSMGRVSPDGRYLSYVNWKNKGNLAIHDFETGENRDITDEANWDKDYQGADASIWSPDSKQIAYFWLGPNEYSSLRIVGIDGSKPRVLCSGPPESELPWPLAWSSDGKHILANQGTKTEETIFNIVLVSVADGSIRVLKSGGSGHASLSPDGRYLVYDYSQSEDSLKQDISLLATDGSHEVTLVKHPADDFAPFWTPDGNRIVFVSDRSGTRGVWVLEVVDGKPKGSPQLISDNLNGMAPLGLTQDGSYYYGLPGRENDIYFADLDLETSKVVGSPYKAIQIFEGLNSRPDFSPDGKRFVYVSPRGPGRWDRSNSFVIRSMETGEEREVQPDLPRFRLLVGSAPRWFPDGRSILVLAKYTDSTKEWRIGFSQIHTETGAVTHVVWDNEQGGIGRGTPPVWSPDGSKMFFMRGGIKVYDLKTKQEWSPDFHSKLGKDYKKHNLAISPDGQQLAFIRCLKDGHSLQIAPSAGGEARELLMLTKAGLTETTGLAWTPDGRHLLFGKRKDEATELWRISVEGGESQNLGLTMKKMEHLSIHPNGRRIAFTGPGPRPGPEVWVMENILSKSTASE